MIMKLSTIFLFNVGRFHAEPNFMKCYTTKFYQPSHIRLLLSLWFNQHSAVSYVNRVTTQVTESIPLKSFFLAR